MSSDIIQSVDRALEILIYLHNAGKEIGITQIAEDLNVYKSTVFRTLNTLEHRGFVKKNPETERYWLGPRLFTLGKSVEHNMGIQEIIGPYAIELYEQYHEVVNVSILEKDQYGVYKSVIIYKAENPNQILKANPPVGSSSECHCSSIGKCLLAFGKNIDLSIYEKYKLTHHTIYTITSIEELKNELKRVKENGYAIDREELEIGLTCIGAPILDRNNYAIAAISLSGPSSRILSNNLEEKIETIKNIAGRISDKF